MVIRLDTIESDFGTITILKRKSTGAVAYEQGGYYQSEADSSGVSLASYIHAIFGLISQIKAHNILLLGCGGGTLATMLARTGRAATIVDVNPASFVVAKQYFELPDSVVCHVADGKSHLRSDTHVYDAIVLDAFHGDRIPSHLQSLRFYNLVRERLAQCGAVFANVHIKHEQDDHADRIADCMANVWPEVRLLDSEGLLGRNAIVMAGNVAQLRAPYVLCPPTAESNAIDAELATMKYRAWRARA
jgi:spermidine synthase